MKVITPKAVLRTSLLTAVLGYIVYKIVQPIFEVGQI
jgi:hypothetical protein